MFHKKVSFILLVSLLLFLFVVGPVNAQTAEQKEASLFDRLGGLAPISVVVSDFLDKLLPDPMVNKNPAIDEARKRVPGPYLKYQITAMVCNATGGPCQYTGRNMKDSHAHLRITSAEWDRMVVIFKEVLASHKVPEKEQQDLLAVVGTTKKDIVMSSEAGA